MVRRSGIAQAVLHGVILAVFTLSSGTARSDTPVSAAEFDAYATGHTITYFSEGMEFGVEQYLPGRQVKWTVGDGICLRGSCYPTGDDICFEYQDGGGPHCWDFTKGADGLTAVYTSDDGGLTLTEAERTTKPLECSGPFLGA